MSQTHLWLMRRYSTSLYQGYGASPLSAAGFSSNSYQGTSGVPPYTLNVLNVRACRTPSTCLPAC